MKKLTIDDLKNCLNCEHGYMDYEKFDCRISKLYECIYGKPEYNSLLKEPAPIKDYWKFKGKDND